MTALFSLIVKMPLLFFVVNVTTTLSIFWGSSRLKSIFLAVLSNQPFLIMKGFIVSNSCAFVVSTRKMFGMLFSFSRLPSALSKPGDAFKRTLLFSPEESLSDFCSMSFSLSELGRNTI